MIDILLCQQGPSPRMADQAGFEKPTAPPPQKKSIQKIKIVTRIRNIGYPIAGLIRRRINIGKKQDVNVDVVGQAEG